MHFLMISHDKMLLPTDIRKRQKQSKLCRTLSCQRRIVIFSQLLSVHYIYSQNTALSPTKFQDKSFGSYLEKYKSIITNTNLQYNTYTHAKKSFLSFLELCCQKYFDNIFTNKVSVKSNATQ